MLTSYATLLLINEKLINAQVYSQYIRFRGTEGQKNKSKHEETLFLYKANESND